MRVFLRTRRPGEVAEENTNEIFAQIPRVGDFLARSHSTPLYVVTLVVWLAESADTLAQVEVYAVEVDRVGALKDARAKGDLTAAHLATLVTTPSAG